MDRRAPVDLDIRQTIYTKKNIRQSSSEKTRFILLTICISRIKKGVKCDFKLF